MHLIFCCSAFLQPQPNSSPDLAFRATHHHQFSHRMQSYSRYIDYKELKTLQFIFCLFKTNKQSSLLTRLWNSGNGTTISSVREEKEAAEILKLSLLLPTSPNPTYVHFNKLPGPAFIQQYPLQHPAGSGNHGNFQLK